MLTLDFHRIPNQLRIGTNQMPNTYIPFSRFHQNRIMILFLLTFLQLFAAPEICASEPQLMRRLTFDTDDTIRILKPATEPRKQGNVVKTIPIVFDVKAMAAGEVLIESPNGGAYRLKRVVNHNGDVRTSWGGTSADGGVHLSIVLEGQAFYGNLWINGIYYEIAPTTRPNVSFANEIQRVQRKDHQSPPPVPTEQMQKRELDYQRGKSENSQSQPSHRTHVPLGC